MAEQGSLTGVTGAYPNHTKRRLAAGKLAVGMVLRQARTVDIAQIAKACGFDFFSIDMEHGSYGVDTGAQIVNAALPLAITPLVRVPAQADHDAVRLLDAGAQGIIVPHVESAEAGRAAVARFTFPPQGERSAGLLPQLGFNGAARPQTAAALNAETLVIAMLESPGAVANAEKIAAVAGIDVLLIGTNDLCAAMGIAGQYGDAKIESAYRKVIAAARKHGCYPGMSGLHVPELVTKFVGLGMRFVVGGSDMSLLMAGARNEMRFLRGLVAE